MSNLRNNARQLRKNATIAENKIWHAINNRQLKFKFTRQYIIDDKYIVDFICREKKLIIEIDGGQHCDNQKDKERDDYLKNQGYKILRFWNNDVLENIEGCLEVILKKLTE